MKKTLFYLFLFAALILPVSGVSAAEQDASITKYTNPAGNPVDQFTGKYWMESTPAEKEAYLFGIDSAITVEAFIAEKNAAKSGKKRDNSGLSIFERNWMKAFAQMSRKEIIQAVDDWYKAHPEELSRTVMGVLWFNVIVPRINEMKKAN